MLNGKVAVITGGTRGIGYSIVKKFLDNGCKVALLGSKEETVNSAIQKLKEINKDLAIYKYIKNIIVTTEPMIKTTTNKIKRFEEIKKIVEE